MDDKEKQTARKRITLIVVLLILGVVLILGLRNWSAIGTKLANPMRSLLGVRTVAQIETFVFKIQDTIENMKYQIGVAEPELPWESDVSVLGSPQATTPAAPSPAPATATPVPVEPSTGLDANRNQGTAAAPTDAPAVPTATATNTAVPTPAGFVLANIESAGRLTGEGIWQPYITNESGEVVGLRTFLQPDPERPYALVAVAAFDLSKTRLHYVLGLKEPSKPGGPHGYGVIPLEDKQPGVLLAAFNGGFIAEHGGYGAMADGVIALAPRSGLATLVIYDDGSVGIGEWGTDFTIDGDYESWRQNALPIIHNGQINPKVETGTWIEWGANLDGATTTLRSSVGLSEDGQVLYYFAGPSLSMPVLADAMDTAGVHNGMLLDINPTHAHFTAMRVEGGELVAEPLYEEEMNLWVDRYLHQWDQDFFYLTARE